MSTGMRVTKRIICLANSRKHGGACVAGVLKDAPYTWVRPVSTNDGKALSDECEYEDGSVPQLLDIIDVPLLSATPAGHQSENWSIDPDARWVKVGKANWEDLAELEFLGETLWKWPFFDLGASSSTGLNNRIRPHHITEVTDSLRLIFVPSLTVYVPPYSGKNRKINGTFVYEGTTYRLSVTDPIVEDKFRDQPAGDYPIGGCYLTVSVGDYYRYQGFAGYYYKLIAGVIEAGDVPFQHLIDRRNHRARLGSTVKLLNLQRNLEQVFKLVSPSEVDPLAGKISLESPLGVAVRNKMEGEVVTYTASIGEIRFRVLEIKEG